MKLELYNLQTKTVDRGDAMGCAMFRPVTDIHDADTNTLVLRIELADGAHFEMAIEYDTVIVINLTNSKQPYHNVFDQIQNRPHPQAERLTGRSIVIDITTDDYCYLTVIDPTYPEGHPLYLVGKYTLGWGRSDLFTCDMLMDECYSSKFVRDNPLDTV